MNNLGMTPEDFFCFFGAKLIAFAFVIGLRKWIKHTRLRKRYRLIAEAIIRERAADV